MMTPAYQIWCKSMPADQCDVLSYTSYLARVDQFICYIDIMWPEFIEKEGLILRSTSIPEDWDSFVQQAKDANWSERDVEYIINHLHITDLFINDPDRDGIDSEVYRFLADLVTHFWTYRLKELFPEKQFEVGIADRDISPEVYAFQIINA